MNSVRHHPSPSFSKWLPKTLAGTETSLEKLAHSLKYASSRDEMCRGLIRLTTCRPWVTTRADQSSCVERGLVAVEK